MIPQAWQFELKGEALRRGLRWMFELRRCRGAVGDESGEARAEWIRDEASAQLNP
jgi:hypothetical protein